MFELYNDPGSFVLVFMALLVAAALVLVIIFLIRKKNGITKKFASPSEIGGEGVAARDGYVTQRFAASLDQLDPDEYDILGVGGSASNRDLNFAPHLHNRPKEN